MLLALLLLDAGRTVSAARLIDELWADSPPAGAANALQSLVSRLRTAIEPVVVGLAPGGYRLVVASEAVDAQRFEQLVAEGRRALAGGDRQLAAERLREGLALWRGEPLADLAGSGFARAAVTRLGQLRVAATADPTTRELLLHPRSLRARPSRLDDRLLASRRGAGWSAPSLGGRVPEAANLATREPRSSAAARDRPTASSQPPLRNPRRQG